MYSSKLYKITLKQYHNNKIVQNRKYLLTL